MKALIVDGEEIFRLSLKEVVSLSADFTEIVTAVSEHDFVTKTAQYENFKLILIHPASVRDESNNCYKIARRLYPDAAIVSIRDSAPITDNISGSSIDRSASISDLFVAIRTALNLPTSKQNFDRTQSNCEDLVRTSLQANQRHKILPENAVGNAPGNASDFSRLSQRQEQILAMASDGNPNKEIAARLNIAEGTVKAHMHAIFKLLRVTNRTQAVIRYNTVHAPYGHSETSQNSSEDSTPTTYPNL